MKKLILGVLASGMIAVSLLAATGAGADGLSLRLGAGRFDDGLTKVLGNSTDAQAQWTNKEARTGKFSVVLEKSAPTPEWVFAGAVIAGAEGMTVADLGNLEMSVKGNCGGGAPRFNLYYDSTGDGQIDGVAFYGCGNNAVGAPVNGWTTMSADAELDDANAPVSGTVVQLSVIVDEQGIYYIDDITVDGVALGEPSGK
jgi:hypothetical protein